MGWLRTAASRAASKSATIRPSCPPVSAAITRPSGPMASADSGKRQTGAVFAGLIAGHDKDPVVEGPGRQVAHPGVVFAFRCTARRGVRHEDDLASVKRHAGRELGEMRVVAELDAEADSGGFEYRDSLAGGESIFFRRRNVQLAVDAQPSLRANNEMAGKHPSVFITLRRTRQNDRLMPLCHGEHAIADLTRKWLGRISNAWIDSISGDVQLGKTDDFRPLPPGGGNEVVHPLDVFMGAVSGGIEDDGGDTNRTHGKSLKFKV